ncbi:traf-type zinc finger domain-containing protein 1 [Phtheirospermum japonicum]|uniref:Traf-type zinc finger domain-containing protein 1 n=1 Tax=Phtheirospermum japonicum TaxID=374723 RepID=A0A830B8V5_9LAMI|nr:traf-type zinc finger domain-containing protein 1 [Phtheirospermum japonicum]
MAEASDDQVTNICSHCDRAIPSSNIDLHFCSLLPGILKNVKHVVSCSLCSETMDRDILDVHKGENCPQRIVTCDYCEFPLPAIDLLEHQVEVCGNRTELCHLCHKYIRLRERHGHESRCTGLVNNIAESSSLLLMDGHGIFYRNVRPPERARGAPRRQPQEFSPRRLLFTIAITGIAVLLGSLFFQRKPDPSQVN